MLSARAAPRGGCHCTHGSVCAQAPQAPQIWGACRGGGTPGCCCHCFQRCCWRWRWRCSATQRCCKGADAAVLSLCCRGGRGGQGACPCAPAHVPGTAAAALLCAHHCHLPRRGRCACSHCRYRCSICCTCTHAPLTLLPGIWPRWPHGAGCALHCPHCCAAHPCCSPCCLHASVPVSHCRAQEEACTLPPPSPTPSPACCSCSRSKRAAGPPAGPAAGPAAGSSVQCSTQAPGEQRSSRSSCSRCAAPQRLCRCCCCCCCCCCAASEPCGG